MTTETLSMHELLTPVEYLALWQPALAKSRNHPVLFRYYAKTHGMLVAAVLMDGRIADVTAFASADQKSADLIIDLADELEARAARAEEQDEPPTRGRAP